MKQGGLNNCQLMHCRKPITDTLDAVKIACANEQRKAHFGKFKKEYVNGRVKDEPPPSPPFKTLRRLCYRIFWFC